jgi:phosphate transport system permease protein
LFAAVMLGFARGVGETMIVWILSGGTQSMPALNPIQTLTSSTRGMPDTIGIEMANVTFEEEHYGHLFLIGLTLFLIVLAINLTGSYIARKRFASS